MYHSVSAKYLQSYINEYAFRYNHRDDTQTMFGTVGGTVRQGENRTLRNVCANSVTGRQNAIRRYSDGVALRQAVAVSFPTTTAYAAASPTPAEGAGSFGW